MGPFSFLVLFPLGQFWFGFGFLSGMNALLKVMNTSVQKSGNAKVRVLPFKLNIN